MGLCSSTKRKLYKQNSTQVSQSQTRSSLSSKKLDKGLIDLYKTLTQYLDLIGCTDMLSAYHNDLISALNRDRVSNDILLKIPVYEECQKEEFEDHFRNSCGIIDFLFVDKHFSQAFPILRENLKMISDRYLEFKKSGSPKEN